MQLFISHSKKFVSSFDTIPSIVNLYDYKSVAILDATGSIDSALNSAYALTQSIDCHWSENPEVDLIPYSSKHLPRSTSVGDLITVINSQGNLVGHFVVAPIGFKQVIAK